MTEKQWAGNKPEPFVKFLLAQAKKNRRILEWFIIGMVRYFEPVLPANYLRICTSIGLPIHNNPNYPERAESLSTLNTLSTESLFPFMVARQNGEQEWQQIGTYDVDRDGVLRAARKYLQSQHIFQTDVGEKRLLRLFYELITTEMLDIAPLDYDLGHLDFNIRPVESDIEIAIFETFPELVTFFNDLISFGPVLQNLDHAISTCPRRSDSREERQQRRDEAIAEVTILLDGLYSPSTERFQSIKFPQWLVLIAKNLFYHYKKPIPFWDRWLTENVVAVAQLIRAEQRFHEMPILGDTLIDAGCNDDSILGHCFQKTPHFDGGWLLERILHERSF